MFLIMWFRFSSSGGLIGYTAMPLKLVNADWSTLLLALVGVYCLYWVRKKEKRKKE